MIDNSSLLTRTRLINAGADAQLTSIVLFSFSHPDTIREYAFRTFNVLVSCIVDFLQ